MPFARNGMAKRVKAPLRIAIRDISIRKDHARGAQSNRNKTRLDDTSAHAASSLVASAAHHRQPRRQSRQFSSFAAYLAGFLRRFYTRRHPVRRDSQFLQRCFTPAAMGHIQEHGARCIGDFCGIDAS